MKTIILLFLSIIAISKFSAANILTQDHSTVEPNKETKIKLRIAETNIGDTLLLYQSMSAPFVNVYSNDNVKYYKAARSQDGWFHFILTSSEEYSYIVISKLKRQADRNRFSDGSNIRDDAYEILPYYQVKSGDDVTIQIRPKVKEIKEGYYDFEFQFSGTGSLKYKLRLSIDSINYYDESVVPLLNPDSTYNLYNKYIRNIRACIALIERNKVRLPTEDYDHLLEYAIDNERARQGEMLSLLYFKEPRLYDLDSLKKERFIKDYKALDLIGIYHIPQRTLMNSRDYLDAELTKSNLISYIKYGQSHYDSLGSYIKNQYTGEFREKLMIYYLKRFGYVIHDRNRIFDEGSKVIKSEKYLAELRKLTTSMIGQPAYNFDLTDINGRRVHLTDFKGKIIFIDFWYTGCGNCINFYKNELSVAEEHFRGDSSVVFLTVSIDKDKKFWAQSVNSRNYTSPSIINLYTNGQGSANDVIKYYQIHTFPQPMIVDKEQNIYSVSMLRTADNIEQTIRSLSQKK